MQFHGDAQVHGDGEGIISHFLDRHWDGAVQGGGFGGRFIPRRRYNDAFGRGIVSQAVEAGGIIGGIAYEIQLIAVSVHSDLIDREDNFRDRIIVIETEVLQVRVFFRRPVGNRGYGVRIYIIHIAACRYGDGIGAGVFKVITRAQDNASRGIAGSKILI